MILNYYAFVNNCPPAPRSEDGSAGGGWGEECRAVRAWKPRRTARILGGRNRAEISLSFFEFFSGGARKRKIVRENFREVAAGASAEAGGGAVQSVFRSKKVRAKDIISPPKLKIGIGSRNGVAPQARHKRIPAKNSRIQKGFPRSAWLTRLPIQFYE